MAQAGRPKKVTEVENVEMEQIQTVESVETTETKIEQNNELQSQVDSLKDLVAQLMKQASEQSSTVNTVKNEDYAEDIPANKFIKVMSLLDHELNLSTGGFGRGRIYSFKKLGQIKDIMYSDLADIINSETGFLEKGAFYILNQDVVKRHGLTDIYENILTKDIIATVYDMTSSEIAEIFKNSSNMQKETIVSLIVKRAYAGEELDYNKLRAMSKFYDRDIVEMVDEIQNPTIVEE